jgi:hypothetical protein
LATIDIVPKYISTVDQVANVITKGHFTIHFSQLCTKLHAHPIPLHLRGAVKEDSTYNTTDIQTIQALNSNV